jgi:hypothetical protein
MWVDLGKGDGYGLIPAEEVGHRSLVRYSKSAPHRGPLDFGGFDELPCDDRRALLNFMGFFIGDGNAPLAGDKNAVVFSLRRHRKIEYLGDVCRRMGWPCELRSGRHFVVRRRGITQLFRSWFYDASGQKVIPPWMLAMNDSDSRAVLGGLMASDGHRYGQGGSWRFDTTSPALAESVVVLGIHGGEAVNGPSVTRRVSPQNDVYHVSFFGRGARPVINQMNRNTSWEPYDGYVYCAKTRTGVLVVRRNGKVCLSGNTEAYWKCDLRNLLHFLALRMDSHAQQEIREYATTIGERIVAPLFPLCWEAFLDYQFGAVTLSRLDVEAVRSAVVGGNLDLILSHIVNKRERDECRDKLFRLGLPEEAPRA